MGSERQIKAILYLAVAAWTVVLNFDGESMSSTWPRPFSIVTTIVIYAVMAFDLWLWKLPFLQGWFVKRPVIEGTWKVEIRSNWVDPQTGVRTSPVEGYMVIRQTFSTLSLRLLTEESSSQLVGTEIVCSEDGLYCVSGVYRNEPRFELRDRSAIHYGALWLRISVGPERRLLGHYWTDRATAGELELCQHRDVTFQDFHPARAHYTTKV